jgi:hypothetical protein
VNRGDGGLPGVLVTPLDVFDLLEAILLLSPFVWRAEATSDAASKLLGNPCRGSGGLAGPAASACKLMLRLPATCK